MRNWKDLTPEEKADFKNVEDQLVNLVVMMGGTADDVTFDDETGEIYMNEPYVSQLAKIVEEHGTLVEEGDADDASEHGREED